MNTVDIYHTKFDVSLFDNIVGAYKRLSSTDRYLYNSISSTHRKVEFLASRFFLERILKDNYSITNSLQDLKHTHYGRPYLTTDLSIPLDFNISHTCNNNFIDIAIAVGRGFMVGIDVIYLNQSSVVSNLSEIYLSSSELKFLNGCDHICNPGMPDPLIRYWSAKEAILKYIGCGFMVDPKNVELYLDPYGKILVSNILSMPNFSLTVDEAILDNRLLCVVCSNDNYRVNHRNIEI